MAEFPPSSSESASGAARFFPFRSLDGSLILRDDVEADGKVALLALPMGVRRDSVGRFTG